MASSAQDRRRSCLIQVGKSVALGSGLAMVAYGTLGVAALRLGVRPRVLVLSYSVPMMKRIALVGGVFGYVSYVEWDKFNDGFIYRNFF